MGVTLYQLSASKGESVNKLKAASTEGVLVTNTNQMTSVAGTIMSEFKAVNDMVWLLSEDPNAKTMSNETKAVNNKWLQHTLDSMQKALESHLFTYVGTEEKRFVFKYKFT